MDSLTHAFAVTALMAGTGHPELIAPGILGAVIPDMDIVLSKIGDWYPRFYILTHGGFTHSLWGGLLLSAVVSAGAYGVTSFLGLPGTLATLPVFSVLLAALAGSMLHILLDLLAYPGVPVLFPLTDRKLTLGFFAGPSPLLLGTSAILLGAIVAGAAGVPAITWYGVWILGVIAARGILKSFVALKNPEQTIPRWNPFSWLLLGEGADSFTLTRYNLIRGRVQEQVYRKYEGVSQDEATHLADLPVVRRLRYHSYIMVALREGPDVVFLDPIRDHGYIPYPPGYRRLRITPERPGVSVPVPADPEASDT